MKKKDSTVNKIAKFLRKEITYSNLKSGHHLKESEISKKFGVSRVPVREAFRILQSEGYIEVIANRGSFVKTLTYEHIMEMAVLYRLLAPVVLEKAIPNYNEKTYSRAESLLDKVEMCSDFSKVGYILWDFAKTIFGPSKLNFILGLIDDIYLHNIRTLNELYVIKQTKSYDTTNHRKFLSFCKKKNKEKAIEVWIDQINKVKRISLKELVK